MAARATASDNPISRKGDRPVQETCWTAEYVLAHCERYRVESDQGTLGYVDEVIETEDGTGALGLLVRTRNGRSFSIGIDDVLELHPSGERIVVRSDLVEQLAERATTGATTRAASRPKTLQIT